MCGFAGYINLDKRPVGEDTLKRMIDAARYRGPDDEGYYINGNIGLGHCRLSIIDLSSGGHQPMASRDKGLWIVHNGEIYNFIELRAELKKRGHSFISGSDTEVIIHAYEQWGDSFLERLNGAFAFAILDLKKHRLFCARDRLGMRFLYYYYDGKRFVFASEIKQLASLGDIPKRPEMDAIADYLLFQYTLEDKTFFRGIRKVLPGQYLVLDLNKKTVVNKGYWGPPLEPLYGLSEEEFADRLRGLLKDSVRLRLRSDVPVASSLSGGLDSSSVTSLASALEGGRLKAFTAKFKDDEGIDESKWAKIAASHANADYNGIDINSEDFERLIPKVIWHLDEPVAGPGALPQYLVSRSVSRHVRVILGGLGGDELFGGYRWYAQFILQRIVDRLGLAGSLFRYRTNPVFIRDFIRRYGMKAFLSSFKRFRFMNDPARACAEVLAIFTERERRLLLRDIPYDPIERFVEIFKKMDGADPLNALLKLELRYYLQALLQVEDRMSMASSLESRAPILDYRIVELACRMPHDIRLSRGFNKSILRKSMSNIVPREVQSRKEKVGFYTPIGPWFIKSKGSALIGNLLKNSCGYFDKRYIGSLYREHIEGRRDNSTRLWRLLSISVWKGLFNIG